MTLNNLKKNHLRVDVSGAELSTPSGRLSIYSFLKFRASWNVPPWSCIFLRLQTLGNQISDSRCSYRETDSLVRSLCSPWREFFFFLLLHIHGSPCLPIPNFYLQPPWPHLRGECRAAVVPCVAAPAARWRASRGRLTAGSLAVPCDQLCVSAATAAARRAPRQAILDRNSSIPPSRQTSATLKVNRTLDRDTDYSGGSRPPVCLATGAAAAFAICAFVVHEISVRFDVFGSSSDDIPFCPPKWELTRLARLEHFPVTYNKW